MRFPLRSVLLFLSLLTGVNLPAADFYPPLPAAKGAIDFDNRGFLIHGKRTFIASAGIEYARVPRELWRDRLLRIKRAGFNCVEIYTFWNYHEVEEGKFDFTGNKDVGAFLDLAHELGLYATVRVGPYVCAEWENGGFPMWLRFKPGLRIRQDDPLYLRYVDEWYDQILPIVASRQIERGGGVIMVQLENEHPEGWGTAMEGNPDLYFKHLMDKARSLGIDVLTFFSGMNHGGDPAPKEPISSQGRPNPWYTTEYWSGWYSMYGAFAPTGDNSLSHFDRAAWRFLENGASGFNVYMFHGGTNFATWNNNETSASYDYAGAVGQAGDLRPIYDKYKRVALFGRSFEDILENCDNATAAHRDDVSGVTVAARTGPAGTIVFLDNPSAAPAHAKLEDGNELVLAPGEVVGLVRDFALDSTFKIVSSETRILGCVRQGSTTTLVIYGPAGDAGQVTFRTPAPPDQKQSLSPGEWASDPSGDITLKVIFPAKEPEEDTLTLFGHPGSKTLRVLTVNSEWADATYFIDQGKSNYVVTGARYIGDFEMSHEGARFTLEAPLDATAAPALSIYGDDNTCPYQLVPGPVQPRAFQLPPLDTSAPVLGNWKSAAAEAEAAPGYDDSKWKGADDPLPMGVDGDTSAYAWYRTRIEADTAGTKFLQIPFIGDDAIAFVNGQRVPGSFGHGPATIPLPLQAGANTLALLTSHRGRDKLNGIFGPIDRLDIKGLIGPVRLSPTQTPQIALQGAVAQAYWKEHPSVETLVDPNLDTSGDRWSQVSFDGNVGGYVPATWREPFVCLRAQLPDLPGPQRILHFGFVYEKVAAYLNGRKIGEQSAAGVPFDLPLDQAWQEGGPNRLVLMVESTHYFNTVGLLSLTSGTPGAVVQGWKMRGGVTPYCSGALHWKPADETAPAVPTYYRTTFSLSAGYYRDATPILRLSTHGLSRGFAWLNGHNVGRYPERIPVDGLYLPECWMRQDANDLVVLDEEGAAIKPAHLMVETVASRRVIREGK